MSDKRNFPFEYVGMWFECVCACVERNFRELFSLILFFSLHRNMKKVEHYVVMVGISKQLITKNGIKNYLIISLGMIF